MPPVEGVLAAAGPFIDYLRPSKSPFLLSIAASEIFLLQAAKSFKSIDIWPQIIGPIILLQVLFTWLVFRSVPATSSEPASTDKVDRDEQLKFSRALCIIVSLFCLVKGTEPIHEKEVLFSIVYTSSIIQLLTFIFYSWLRTIREENDETINFFQISFVTSIYLIGIMQLSDKIEPESLFTVSTYSICILVNLILWIICITFWIKIVLGVVKFSVKID